MLFSEARHLVSEAQTYGAIVLADGGKLRVKGVSKLPPPQIGDAVEYKGVIDHA